MRLHLLALVVWAGPCVAYTTAGDPSGVWHADYARAVAEAQHTERPLLIHFYADWCGPCRQMEARVLNQPAVLDGLRDRAVAVKVNYDQRADLVSRFSIDLLPCDLLVAHDGQVLLRTTGFVDETTYVERIKRLAPATNRNGPAAVSSAMIRNTTHARHLGAVEQVGMRLLAASGH
jgi:thioredoxin-like negative regulator of GroEL